MARSAKSLAVCVVAFITVVQVATVSESGPIFIPGRLVDGRFVPPKQPEPNRGREAAAVFSYTVRYGSISAKVRNKHVTTELSDSIQGPQKAVETVGLILLPADAEADSVKVTTQSGRSEPEIVRGAKFLDAESAGKLFLFYPGRKRLHLLGTLGMIHIVNFWNHHGRITGQLRLNGNR